MAFCRYCGKELVNGSCSCPDFVQNMQNSTAQYQGQSQNQYQESYQYQTEYQQGQYQYQKMNNKDSFFVSSFSVDTSSVRGFFSSIRDMFGVSETASDVSDPYERNVPIVPDCVPQEDNEIVIKQYNFAKLRTRLKLMKAEGRIMVTNKRVLFRAAGTSLRGNVVQEHQYDIGDIAGVEIHKNYKFSILNLLGSSLISSVLFAIISAFLMSVGYKSVVPVGVILGLLGLLPTFVVYKHFWIKMMAAMVSSSAFFMAFTVSGGSKFLLILNILAAIVMLVNLIIVCFVPNLILKIKAKGGINAVVIGSHKPISSRIAGDDSSGFAEVLPWVDSITVINELGSMIDDIQKNGDFAVAKWCK